MIWGFVSKFFPKKENDFDIDKEVLENGEFYMGAEKIPTKEEWESITVGMSQDQVLNLLGKPGHSVQYEDKDIWKYCRNKFDKLENADIIMLPFGDVYFIYFDKNKTVINKEYEFISKEKIRKLINEPEEN